MILITLFLLNPFYNYTIITIFFYIRLICKILIFFYGLFKKIKKNLNTWNFNYEKNILYTYADLLFVDLHFINIKKIFIFSITLTIHRLVTFIQILFFVDFLTFYIITKKKKKQINKKNIFKLLFLTLPSEKAFFVFNKIKNFNINQTDLKTLTINILFIYGWGKSRWIINNCIIITKFLENYYKHRIKKKKFFDLFKTIINDLLKI